MKVSKARHRQARYSAREDDKQWMQDTCRETRLDTGAAVRPPLPSVKRHDRGGIHTAPPRHRMLMLRRPERESCAFPTAFDFAPLASLLAKTFQKRRVSSAAAKQRTHEVDEERITNPPLGCTAQPGLRNMEALNCSHYWCNMFSGSLDSWRLMGEGHF